MQLLISLYVVHIQSHIAIAIKLFPVFEYYLATSNRELFGAYPLL